MQIASFLLVLFVVSACACIGIALGINCCINNKKKQYPGAPGAKEATKTDAMEANVADVKLGVDDGNDDLAQLREQKATAAAKAAASP